MYTSFIAALIAGIASATADVQSISLGQFKLKNAAFPAVESFKDSEDFLLVSSFGAFSAGRIYVVPGIKEAVVAGDASGLKSVILDTPNFEWPNVVKTVPHDVFNGTRAIVIPDGFLPPGKTHGGIFLTVMDDTDVTKTVKTVQMTHNRKGYFYHMGFWVDMNGDGRKDFLTAKTNAKAGGGSLVWYEHPVDGLDAKGDWTEHVVCEGPDVGIEMDTFVEYPDEVIVFAAEFFNEKLGFYRVSTKDGTLVDSRIIDDTTLHAYSVQMVDLNGDGKKQLVMNNHEKSDKTNGIWAYTMPYPKDFMTGDFVKYPLALGFKNAFSMTIPNMAPGFPYAIWPETKTEGSTRAHIAVAGDGDHSVSILTPTGDASTFEYQKDLIKNEGGTVGALAFSDLDNNGWKEMWVPNYDGSYVELFKFTGEYIPQPEFFLQ